MMTRTSDDNNPIRVVKLRNPTLPFHPSLFQQLRNMLPLPRAAYSVLLMYSTPRASRSTRTGSCTGFPKTVSPPPLLYKFVIRRT
jgi:hypothetical protein